MGSLMEKVLRRFKAALTRLQTGWSILGITLVLLMLVEGGFQIIFAVRDWLTAVPVPDPRVVAEGYAGAAWPAVHFRELEQLQERWQPYVYFRQKPFSGKTITIGTNGRRTTWQSALRGEPCDVRPGGQDPDSGWILALGLWCCATIRRFPRCSRARSMSKGGMSSSENLAEIGYVSTQEVIALTQALQAGDRPDVVIFYDGVNDTTSALLEGEPGVTTNEINRRREFNLTQSPGRMATAFSLKLVTDSGSYRFAQMVRRRLGGKVEAPPDRPGHVPGAGRRRGSRSRVRGERRSGGNAGEVVRFSPVCSSGSRTCSPRSYSLRPNAKRPENTPGPNLS